MSSDSVTTADMISARKELLIDRVQQVALEVRAANTIRKFDKAIDRLQGLLAYGRDISEDWEKCLK